MTCRPSIPFRRPLPMRVQQTMSSHTDHHDLCSHDRSLTVMGEMVWLSLSSPQPPENQGMRSLLTPYDFRMTRRVNPRFQSARRPSRKRKESLRSKLRSDRHKSRPSRVNLVAAELCDQVSRECQGIAPHQVSYTFSCPNLR